MNNVTILKPVHSQKSFYGKAQIIETENGLYLQSYNTIVCGIENGKIKKYWNDYSVTTMKHINAFIETFTDQRGYSKKEWLTLETSTTPNIKAVTFDYDKMVSFYKAWY